jgi:uncharacterized tellurite resistance protein B-like protein
MLDRLLSMIVGASSPAGRPGRGRLPLAAAALMVEAAMLEGGMTPAERRRIAALLSRRFALDSMETAALIEEAEDEAERSSQLFEFTRKINESFDHAQRIELIEMLWDVAYADDALHHMEANLMRRVAGLLHVEDRDSGAARKRVLARRDVKPS